MTTAHELIRDRLKEIERAFTAFERGDRNRLYDTRDSLLGLTSAVESSAVSQLGPLCEIASRLLGLVIMEGGLTEARSVQIVQELLGFVEAQVMDVSEDANPGGVFHVVNSEKVGEILVRKGLINPDQLDKALLLQRVSKGRRMGQVLVAMNAIDQRTLDEVLDNQKAETRRAETRRGSTLGKTSLPVSPTTGGPMNPIPPMPGYHIEDEPPAALPLPAEAQDDTPEIKLPGAPSHQQRPGLQDPGMNAPNHHGPKQGLDWLDGK